MALKQPRVPELHEGESLYAFCRALIFFLKDFSTGVWSAINDMNRRIKNLEDRG